ncbi:hypothetical protein Tco_1229077 [Tanacetum coccineum]
MSYWDQVVATMKVYRGGSGDEEDMNTAMPPLFILVSNLELVESLGLVLTPQGLKDVASFLAAAAEEKKKRGHVLSYLTMEKSKLLSKLL